MRRRRYVIILAGLGLALGALALLGRSIYSQPAFSGSIEAYGRFCQQNQHGWFLRHRPVTVCGKIDRKTATGLDGTFFWEAPRYQVGMGLVTFWVNGHDWHRLAEGQLATLSGTFDFDTVRDCQVK